MYGVAMGDLWGGVVDGFLVIRKLGVTRAGAACRTAIAALRTGAATTRRPKQSPDTDKPAQLKLFIAASREAHSEEGNATLLQSLFTTIDAAGVSKIVRLCQLRYRDGFPCPEKQRYPGGRSPEAGRRTAVQVWPWSVFAAATRTIHPSRRCAQRDRSVDDDIIGIPIETDCLIRPGDASYILLRRAQ